eukprot:gene8689-636_t
MSKLALLLLYIIINCVYSLKLEAVLIEEPPFTFYRGGIPKGFSIDLIKETKIRWMNFFPSDGNVTINTHKVADGKYGSNNGGVWSGMIGEVIYGKADVSFAPITANQARLGAVRFITPFLDVGLRIMIRKPEKESALLYSFLLPFTWQVWTAIIACLVSFMIFLWIFDVCSPYGYHRHPEDDKKHTMDFSNAIISGLLGFVGQAGDPGRNFATKILTIGYFLFSLIVVSTYTANLAAFLTTSGTSKSLQTLSDIRTNRYKFGIVDNSSISNYFENNDEISDLLDLAVRYDNFTTMVNDLLAQKNGLFALVHDSPVTDYQENQPPCKTLEVGSLFYPSNFVFVTKLNATFGDKLERIVLSMREDGFIENLYKKWWYDRGACATLGEEEELQSQPIGIDSFGGILITLGCFVFVSFILLITENIYFNVHYYLGDRLPFLRIPHRFFGGGHIAEKGHGEFTSVKNTVKGAGAGIEKLKSVVDDKVSSGATQFSEDEKRVLRSQLSKFAMKDVTLEEENEVSGISKYLQEKKEALAKEMFDLMKAEEEISTVKKRLSERSLGINLELDDIEEKEENSKENPKENGKEKIDEIENKV